MSQFPLRAIISGGQAGADRAGLEVGKRLGFRTGRTAPKGFRTNKGPDPSLKQFGLEEDPSSEYPPRTVKNVQNSDGTVWFGNVRTPGGKLTIGRARREGKALTLNPDVHELRQWIIDNGVETLNVAGDREENDPGIQQRVEEILMGALGDGRDDSLASAEGKDILPLPVI